MSTKVLVVDDKQMMRDSVGTTLQRAGYTVIAAADGATALKQVAKHRPACVVTDLMMPEMSGLELLAHLGELDAQLPVVLMTAYGSVSDAVEAMKVGAFDFIQKPFEGDELILTVRRAVAHFDLLQENAALRSNAEAHDSLPDLVGRTAVMREMAQQIRQIANCHSTVLICGESGSGKEVVARTLHANSPRRDKVMLAVNCAALSSTLLESELFGHEKGAFTGADQMRKGRFELADGGTLLLDEISEISPELQAKLLRVLQEQQFERVGSSTTLDVDVRVIATTNRDLAQSVAEGSFRQDLFYRLNVLPVHVPALRQRLGDIPLLAEHFLGRVASREGREPKQFDEDALLVLQQYHWPGNVRELQNICERASVLAEGNTIAAETIQPWLVQLQRAAPPVNAAQPVTVPGVRLGANGHAGYSGFASPSSPIIGEPRTLEEVEREQILLTLDQFGGNRRKTAEALGIALRTLGLKLKKWKEQKLVAETV